MKWFQVDSDTPDDPRIKAVQRRLGLEGVGGLFSLWCYIANHGAKPGRSIDSNGRPFPLEDLREASGLQSDKFNALVEICVDSGHFKNKAWVEKQEIHIPAMCRRADPYTRRRIKSK